MSAEAVKARKLKVERYDVDGVSVELRQAEVSDPLGYTTGGGSWTKIALRSQWEVWIDGVHRGYATMGAAPRSPWLALSLEPRQAQDQHSFKGVAGLYKILWPLRPGSTFESDNTRWAKDRTELARGFAQFHRDGRAPTLEEGLERERARLGAEAADKADRAASEARYAAQARVREVEAVATYFAVLRVHRETREGLEAMRERLGGQMTNFELLSLGRAIDDLRPPAKPSAVSWVEGSRAGHAREAPTALEAAYAAGEKLLSAEC